MEKSFVKFQSGNKNLFERFYNKKNKKFQQNRFFLLKIKIYIFSISNSV